MRVELLVIAEVENQLRTIVDRSDLGLSTNKFSDLFWSPFHLGLEVPS